MQKTRGTSNEISNQPHRRCCALTTYLKSNNFHEVILCMFIGLFLAFIPYLFIPLNVRPVLYQLTNEGDVILDLTYNNELVNETVPSKF